MPTSGGVDGDKELVWGTRLDVLIDIQMLLNIFDREDRDTLSNSPDPSHTLIPATKRKLSPHETETDRVFQCDHVQLMPMNPLGKKLLV